MNNAFSANSECTAVMINVINKRTLLFRITSAPTLNFTQDLCAGNSNFRYYKMHIYFLLVIISVFIDEAGLRAGRSCYTSFCVAALGRRSPVHSLLTSDLPTDIHSSLKTQSPVLTLQTCKSLLCTKPNFYSFRDITV